jgi:two-component system response regulator NreC
MLDDYVKQRTGDPVVVIDRYETLSDREREVFSVNCGGKTNKDIAGLLFISPSTVETHRAHIMEARRS